MFNTYETLRNENAMLEHDNALLQQEVMRLTEKCNAIDNDFINAAMNLSHITTEFKDCRNFACQLCGKYKTAHLGSCNGCRWYDSVDVNRMDCAAAAMCEQEAREKGCEYCQQGEEMAYGKDGMQREGYIYLDGNLLTADLYSESMAVAVCFCPMCGRRLKEDNHE